MQELDWKWQPNSIMFGMRRFVHDPVFGKQIHQFASPFRQFELTLPPKAEKDRREIAAFLNDTEGTAVVNVYDPRVPVPGYYNEYRNDKMISQRVPDLIVAGTNSADRTITVRGSDRITKDDPIAFTHSGVRHYYRALDDLVLNGSNQSLRVDLRPRVDIPDTSIITDRIRPTCRFQVFINDHGGLTNADGYTDFSLRGVEFFGAI